MTWRRILGLAALAVTGNFLTLWLTLRAIREFNRSETDLLLQVVRETSRALFPPPPPEREPGVQPSASPSETLEFDPNSEDVPVWAQGLSAEEYQEMIREGFDPRTGLPLR